MVSVNEYRDNLAARIRDRRMATEQKRLQIEEKRNDAIIKWRQELEETERQIFDLLAQREKAIMDDNFLSEEKKEELKKSYSDAYLPKIKEAEQKFNKIFEEKHKEIEENDAEFEEFLFEEQNSDMYKFAKDAHMRERNSNFKVRKLQSNVEVAESDLEQAQEVTKSKRKDKQAVEQKVSTNESRRKKQDKLIEELAKQLEIAKEKKLKLDKEKEEISKMLAQAISEESIAEESEKQFRSKKTEAVNQRNLASNESDKVKKENEELDIELITIRGKLAEWWVLKPETIKKIIKCLQKEWTIIPVSHIESWFVWDKNWEAMKNRFIKMLPEYWREVQFDKKEKWITRVESLETWRKEEVVDDKTKLLKEVEKIDTLTYARTKISKYLWIYQKLGYEISDRKSLLDQLCAAHSLHPSILNDIKKDIVKRIQDPVNNRPEKKKWNWGTFFVIDLYCDGVNGRILIAEDKKTMLCAAPHIPYERILRWEITNLTQVFDWKK